jgi:hypothetical protein
MSLVIIVCIQNYKHVIDVDFKHLGSLLWNQVHGVIGVTSLVNRKYPIWQTWFLMAFKINALPWNPHSVIMKAFGYQEVQSLWKINMIKHGWYQNTVSKLGWL